MRILAAIFIALISGLIAKMVFDVQASKKRRAHEPEETQEEAI